MYISKYSHTGLVVPRVTKNRAVQFETPLGVKNILGAQRHERLQIGSRSVRILLNRKVVDIPE